MVLPRTRKIFGLDEDPPSDEKKVGALQNRMDSMKFIFQTAYQMPNQMELLMLAQVELIWQMKSILDIMFTCLTAKNPSAESIFEHLDTNPGMFSRNLRSII